MTTPDTAHVPHVDRTSRIKVLWAIAASSFWAIFLWGFWSRGVFALGLNAFIYLASVVGLFLWWGHRKAAYGKADLAWIVPICLLVVSVVLYENPFFKAVSLLVFPALFVLFYNLGALEERAKARWDGRLFAALFVRALNAVARIGDSVRLFGRVWSASEKKEDGTAKRIVVGVFLFLAIAVTVVIPLLSAADATFAAGMQHVFDWVERFVSPSTVVRTCLAFLFSILTVAALLAWGKPFTHSEAERAEKAHIDPIISGIVIGGILALYLLFLGIQVKLLLAGGLPFEFSEVEYVVKSGFWQLLSLTVLNILIFFFAYRRTIPAVQRLLAAFSVASLLLLLSAAHRMGLYVTYYGLSYEKFYASYAVLFCGILLTWSISRLFVRGRADILRFIAMQFLWMYALVAIVPVERIVLHANVALAQREGSMIRLYELTMLSVDVLGPVERYEREGKLKEKNPLYDREIAARGGATSPDGNAFDWNPWINTQEDRSAAKAWYEKNLSDVLPR